MCLCAYFFITAQAALMLVLLEARLVMLMRLLTWRLNFYHCSSSTHACFIGGEIGDADEAFDVEVTSLSLLKQHSCLFYWRRDW